MSESIFSRVSRLISASANSVVDSIENTAPELVIEEAVRELESAKREVLHSIGEQEARRHLATKRLEEENKQHTVLSGQIQVAVKQGRDDLASVAIEKQLDIETQLPVLQKTVDDASAEIQEYENYLKALDAKRREILQQLQDIRSAKTEINNSAESSSRASTVKQKEDKATNAVDRVMSRLGSGTTRSSADASALADLEELARKNRIEERLAAIKSEA